MGGDRTKHDGIPDATLDGLLQQRLLAVIRRSLYADLQVLAEQGWIKRQAQH